MADNQKNVLCGKCGSGIMFLLLTLLFAWLSYRALSQPLADLTQYAIYITAAMVCAGVVQASRCFADAKMQQDLLKPLAEGAWSAG